MSWETWVQSQVESTTKTQKMVLDAALLHTQHYKVRIKGKVEQSRERSCNSPLHVGVVAIEKVAFGSPSIMVANFSKFNSFKPPMLLFTPGVSMAHFEKPWFNRKLNIL